jgi:hypothetical protein
MLVLQHCLLPLEQTNVSQTIVRGSPQTVRENSIATFVSGTGRIKHKPIHVCAKTDFVG